MAVVELQIEESALLELLRTEFDRQRLPGPSVGLPGLATKHLQRIRCANLSVQDSGSSGQVALATTVVVEYNDNLAEVRSAGSLQRPVPHELRLHPPAMVAVILPASPKGAPAVRVSVPGFWTFDAPLIIPDQFSVHAGAIVADDGAVAVRLGTLAVDPVQAPLVGHVAPGEWRQLVTGAVYAEILESVLTDTIQGIVSDQLRAERPARGQWVGSSKPYAVAGASLRVVTPVLDVVLDLQLVLTPEVVDRELQLTVQLTWSARTGLDYLVDFLAPIFGRLVLDEVLNAQVVGRLPGTLSQGGFEEIARDDESITLRGRQPLEPALGYFVFQRAEVTKEGVVSAGPVQLQRPRQGLEVWMSRGSYSLDKNCGARRVDVAFNVPRLWLRDLGVAGQTGPQVFYDAVVFEPEDAWDLQPAPHSTWFETLLTLEDPPGGRLAAGTPTSVYLATDCGIIWVDLGEVPPRPPDPGVEDIAEMLSSCLAISARGGIKLNLEWLIDPPDVLNTDDLVRDWSLRFRDLPPDSVFDVEAVDKSGAERHIATVAGRDQGLVHMLTGPTEHLVLRAPEGSEAPIPMVEQRWMEPVASIATPLEVRAIDVVDEFLGVRNEGGQMTVVDLAQGGVVNEAQNISGRLGRERLARLEGHLDRQFERLPGAVGSAVADLSADTAALGVGRNIVLAKVHGFARLQ